MHQQEEMNVWVSASSLALGFMLERDRAVLEDACWLQPTNDAQHIYLAELDTMASTSHYNSRQRLCTCTPTPLCLPLGVQYTDWKSKNMHQGNNEMLIRTLDILKTLVSEYDQTVSITLVTSYCNLADQLI